MKRLDPTIQKETIYIALGVLLMSVLMQAVFLIIGRWDYTVLLGNLLGGGISVLNFLLMGLSVQRAVKLDEKGARSVVRTSQSLRMVLVFAVVAVGAALPCFNPWAVVIPILFPRIAIAARPLFNKYLEKEGNV